MTIITSLVMNCSLDNCSIVGREDKSIARTNQRGNINKSKWPIPKQKNWQVPTATHIGWGTGHVNRTKIQIKSPKHQGHGVPLTPKWFHNIRNQITNNNYGLITSYPSDHNISHINTIRIWLFHLPKDKRLITSHDLKS